MQPALVSKLLSITVLHQKFLLLTMAETQLQCASLAASEFANVSVQMAQAAALTLLVEEERSRGKDSMRTFRKPKPIDKLCSFTWVNYYASSMINCHLGEEAECCLPYGDIMELKLIIMRAKYCLGIQKYFWNWECHTETCILIQILSQFPPSCLP